MHGNGIESKITFNPKKITAIHENCSNCNLRYMIEPSFYYGAMYVNYGITVALSILTFSAAFTTSFFVGMMVLRFLPNM